MRDWIAEAAGGSGTVTGDARARVEQRPDGRWVAELDVGDGPRTLRGDTCNQVARAAALVIGIALRGGEPATAEPGQAADAEIPWRTPQARTASDVTVERTVRRPAPRPVVAVHAAIGAITGALPDVAPLARAGLEVRRERLAGRLEGAVATAPRALILEGGQEALVRMTFVAASGSGCYAVGRLWLCGGVEVGQLRAAASAADAAVSGAGLWLAGHAGPTTAVALSRTVDLVLEAEAAVPLTYPRFSVNGMALPGPSPVSLRTNLGLRVEIP